MRQEKPMISVIVPVYNTEKYLVTCLNSLLAQTYPNLEILLIDDASTDQSGQVCEDYAARDRRLKVIHFPKNQGPSAARNEGIRRAEGGLISFVDADDHVEPDLLEKLYDALLENEADISICGADGIRIKDGAADTFSGKEAVCCLARGTPFNLVPWGKLYDARLVRACPFDERVFYSEDLLFLYKVFQRAKRVSYFPAQLYHYVNREDSQVHSGISDRKCTALFVHNQICRDAAVHFPEVLPDFQQIALDTNTRMAMFAMETDLPRRQLFGYLRRLCRNTRRHISRKSLMRCRERKVAAAAIILYAGEIPFYGMAVIYKQIKRIRHWRTR